MAQNQVKDIFYVFVGAPLGAIAFDAINLNKKNRAERRSYKNLLRNWTTSK